MRPTPTAARGGAAAGLPGACARGGNPLDLSAKRPELQLHLPLSASWVPPLPCAGRGGRRLLPGSGGSAARPLHRPLLAQRRRGCGQPDIPARVAHRVSVERLPGGQSQAAARLHVLVATWPGCTTCNCMQARPCRCLPTCRSGVSIGQMKYCNTADLNGIVPSIKDGGCATVEQIQDAVHNKVRRAVFLAAQGCPVPPGLGSQSPTCRGPLAGSGCHDWNHTCTPSHRVVLSAMLQAVTITIMNITSEDGNPRLVNELWDSEALTVFACVSAASALLPYAAGASRDAPLTGCCGLLEGGVASRSSHAGRWRGATLVLTVAWGWSACKASSPPCASVQLSPHGNALALQAYDDCALGSTTSSDGTVAKIADQVRTSGQVWLCRRQPAARANIQQHHMLLPTPAAAHR